MSLAQHIARVLRLSEGYILQVAASASYRYKQFTIKKADGKSNRLIEQPSKELKLLQRWLVRQIFDLLPTHPAAHAYIKGKSIKTNALIHRKSRYISRLDFENFFPSLTRTDVELLVSRAGVAVGGSILTSDDIRLIGSLTCRFGKLTIGAPSSPTVSNKLMYEIDTRLAEMAKEVNVAYTRYADDLYFSSSEPGTLYKLCKQVEELIDKISSPRLAINKKKTYHASRKRRMVVTGLRVTPDGNISVGRDLKRKIRALAHKAQTGAIKASDLIWLHGMLAYVSSIEPQFTRRIRAKYRLS